VKLGAFLVGGGTGGKDFVNKGKTSGYGFAANELLTSFSNCKGGKVKSKDSTGTRSFNVFGSPGHRWLQGS